MANDLGHATAAELVGLYRRRAASPVEAVREILSRIDRLNTELNCFCYLDPEGAIAAAEASEARWGRGEPAGPLDGVPVSIKDLTIVKGWPTRRGSKTVDANGPWDEDAPLVEMLRAGGAVLLGKTTTPEFGWKGVTDSPLTGITRNPWDTGRTAGGSSGGAAAAAAAFLGPLHQGSDAAGSIRIPAAFCGVFGFKPTFGVVANYPLPAHIGPLANNGPIARTVTDAALLLTEMARRGDYRDPTTSPVQGLHYGSGLDDGVVGCRIAFSPTMGVSAEIDAGIAAEVARAATVFADLGATVDEADPPMAPARAIIDILWPAAIAWLVDQIPKKAQERMDPGLLELAARGAHWSAGDLIGAQADAHALGVAMSRFHDRYDLLLTPQMPLEAFSAGIDFPPGHSWWLDWSPFTYPFNITQQPAASVPLGTGPGGLPIGLQIVGRRFEDTTVLRAARAFERDHPFGMPPGT